MPDGAPARVKEGQVPPADQDTKFSYLWACRAWLDATSKIVIATGACSVWGGAVRGVCVWWWWGWGGVGGGD